MSFLPSGRLAILTPTGNTGRHVVDTALAQGQTVRVLVRDAARLDATVRERCQVVEGDMLNPTDVGSGGLFFASCSGRCSHSVCGGSGHWRCCRPVVG